MTNKLLHMKRLFVYIFLVLFSVGCATISPTAPLVVKQEYVGNVVSAEHIEGTWNGRDKTILTTETYSIAVVDMHSVKIGSPVTLFTFNTGRICAFVGELPTTGIPYSLCWLVYD